MPTTTAATSTLKQLVAHAPRVPATGVFAAVSISGFAGLILQNEVSPLLVYCLQLFLAA